MTKTIEHLITQGPPTTLRFWAWQAMVASFADPHDLIHVWGGTLEYLGWLDSLPVKEKP